MSADQLWQQLTLQGNELFDRGEHQRAQDVYEQARSLVLHSFDQWDCSEDAVAAVVVSHLNLSEAQARCGELDTACHTLCSIYASLLRARDDGQLHPLLREAAARHVRETFAALQRFRSRYGERPELHDLLCPDCQRPAAAGHRRTLH